MSNETQKPPEDFAWATSEDFALMMLAPSDEATAYHARLERLAGGSLALVPRRIEKEGPMMSHQRSKQDTVRPCQVCGWAEHMAIHSIIKEGPRAGQPFGHAYVPPPPAIPRPVTVEKWPDLPEPPDAPSSPT